MRAETGAGWGRCGGEVGCATGAGEGGVEGGGGVDVTMVFQKGVGSLGFWVVGGAYTLLCQLLREIVKSKYQSD